MTYINKNFGDYGGLAAIWGAGPLPSITIPKNPSGSFIIPGRADPYWGYPAGWPYVGMRPPPPLFGPANPPFKKSRQPLQKLGPGEIIPMSRTDLPSQALYELWDARRLQRPT